MGFFNEHDFLDVCGQGFPTRRFFARGKARAPNGKLEIRWMIEGMPDPGLWVSCLEPIGTCVRELTNPRYMIGYEVVREGFFYRLRRLSSSLTELGNRFDESDEISELVIGDQLENVEKTEMLVTLALS